MTVACNILDCGYNTSGICCQKYYVVIQNGQCSWLINNPNYRIRGPIQECSICESKADIVSIDEANVNTTLESNEKPKRKYTKKKKAGGK